MYNYIDWCFGIRKLKVANGKILKSGYLYRIILAITTICITTWTIKKKMIELSMISIIIDIPIILVYLITLSFVLTNVAYVIIIMQNISFCPNEAEKIFSLFSELENYLGLVNKSQKIKILFYYVFLILLKVVLCLIEINLWEINMFDMILYHFIVLSFDLEILHFMIEVNVTARYFEKFNHQMIYFFDCAHFKDFSDGIILRLWKNNYEKLSKSDIEIKSSIFIIEKLSNIVNALNSCYGTKVNVQDIK